MREPLLLLTTRLPPCRPETGSNSAGAASQSPVLNTGVWTRVPS